ncbi:uncharacterized protein LOC128168021 [Crassostrea angulata]|uniref:uncharacterized protein LOC128168021 n=1 Tax=Magallana angulata TaxID=2784310 RepID=UPI0022B14E21|nr:uncharacterized protein LOC128168021 [Crassostrea angulata]
MNLIYVDRMFEMLSLLFLILSICSGDPCVKDESSRSFFFMKSIPTKYSVYGNPNEFCVCKNNSCSRTNETESAYQNSTIYRINEKRDVHVRYSFSRHNAYKDSFLGTEYVVPVLQDISAQNIQNFLGVGNPTNTDIVVQIRYTKGNRFSGKICQNESIIMLPLGAYETIDFKISCQNPGIYINSSDKIIVYSAALIQESVMIEQLLSVELWGSSYMVFPFRNTLHDNIIIVLTAYDNTTVHIIGFDNVIIPNKYDSIQRRISGSYPITIRSSKPVSVILYITKGNESASINIIPMKYKVEENDITHMTFPWYVFASLNPSETLEERELSIFSRFYYYTNISKENLPQSIYGCVAAKTTLNTKEFSGTNCGFVDRNQTEPDWPIMEPGDGKDNNKNGEIDEDDCFSSFANLTGNVNNDCKSPFKSGFSDTLGSMFVLPFGNTMTVKCSAEIFSGTLPTEVKIYSKPINAETIVWNLTTIQINNNDFIIDRNISASTLSTELELLVIVNIESNNVSLICSCYNLNKTCSNSFIVPPVDTLQTQYVLVMPVKSENGNNNHIQCNVVTIFDSTSFALPMLNISHENIPRLTTTRINWTMQNSPVFIVASHVISVICFQGFDDNYLVNYILPSFGTDYKMCLNENQTKEIVMVSLDYNTSLNISEIDPDNYTEHVLLETGGSLRNYKMKNSSSFLSIKANKPILVLAWIETSSSPSNYNIIYVPAANLVLNSNIRSSNHSEDECLSLSDYTQPQPFRLYRRELPTVTEQIPGDGIDNDGDGLVDEEYCGFLWEEYNITDIDLDGSMNEDCKGCKEGEELSLLFVCKDCDFGKFREKESKIDFCQICPENHTTFNTRSNSSKDCVPICEEGTELNSTKETCEPCSIGFYKDVSANDVSVNKTDRFECKRCPGNLTTYSIKSTDISDCIGHCESGHYLYNKTCLPCEIGKYKNTSSRDISLDEMLRWHCLACEGQSTTISNGSKTCIMPCREGSQFNFSSHQCEPCPVGFYKNITGIHINCTQCPNDYTTRAPGKKSQNDCKKADCTCPCNMVHVQRNYTSSELSKVIEKMKKELIVNKEQLSSTLRKKISVKDNRPSSQSIGSFGVVIIVFVFALLLAADVMILKNHISMLVRTLVDFAKRCSRN